MSLLANLKRLFGFSDSSAGPNPGDRVLVCEDCKKDFIFDAGEQQFFQQKGFTDPKRCPRCRKKVRFRMRRGGRGRGRDRDNDRNDRNNGGGNHHHNNGRHNNRHHRRPSGIDGDSPYADER